MVAETHSQSESEGVLWVIRHPQESQLTSFRQLVSP